MKTAAKGAPIKEKERDRRNHPWEDWEDGIILHGKKNGWQLWYQEEVARFVGRDLPAIQQRSHDLGKKTKSSKRRAR